MQKKNMKTQAMPATVRSVPGRHEIILLETFILDIAVSAAAARKHI
jgi:hypothetical protein